MSTACIETTVVSGGARLHVISCGPRASPLPPLVFLHAGVCDSRMWQGELDAFCAEGASPRGVVAFDRRGFGRTASIDEPYSQVADLLAVLDALAIDRPVLVGCSQGGRIAIDATLAHPSRVAGLVLVAAAIGGEPEPGTVDPRLRRLFERYEDAERRGDVEAENRIAAHVWLDGPLEPEGRVGGAVRDLFFAMNRIALDAPKLGTADRPTTSYANLGRIGVPTLVVWGSRDVPGVTATMRHAAQAIPRARAREIDAAHLPNLEQPAAFREALRDFLDS